MPAKSEVLNQDRVGDIVSVFVDAFRDYPVMRYVVGDAGADYDARLQALVHFFVMRSVRQQSPMLGISDGGVLVAAATVTLPGRPDAHPGADEDRERLWGVLGSDARARYEAYKAASTPIEVRQPHHYLNLIGVRASHQGRGLSRPLLEDVGRLSDVDPQSEGVGLTTELARNVPLYQHFGYQLVGQVAITPALECWSLFRPNRVRDLPD